MGIGTGTILVLLGLVFGLDRANLPGLLDRRIGSDRFGWTLVVVGLALIAVAVWANHRRHRGPESPAPPAP